MWSRYGSRNNAYLVHLKLVNILVLNKVILFQFRDIEIKISYMVFGVAKYLLHITFFLANQLAESFLIFTKYMDDCLLVCT